jgi:hypothetical protein
VLPQILKQNKNGELKMDSAYKRMNLVLFFIFCFSLFGSTNSRAAINTEGNYCWNIKITEDQSGIIPPEIYTMKLHIVPVGNKTTAIIRGSVIVTDDYSPVVTGIASISSSSINANLDISQRHKDNTWNDTSSLQIIINQSTLIGTFFQIGLDFDRTTKKFDTRYSRGQLIPIKCP